MWASTLKASYCSGYSECSSLNLNGVYGMCNRVANRKPLLSKKNITAAYSLLKAMWISQKATGNFLWTDETKNKLFTYFHRVRIFLLHTNRKDRKTCNNFPQNVNEYIECFSLICLIGYSLSSFGTCVKIESRFRSYLCINRENLKVFTNFQTALHILMMSTKRIWKKFKAWENKLGCECSMSSNNAGLW